MLRYHMAVITNDKRLKREVQRVTTATNSTADFLTDDSKFAEGTDVNLVIFDAREQGPSSDCLEAIPSRAAISYVLKGSNLFHQIELLSDQRVASLLCRDESLDDDEFIANATKSLRNDIFGLHKYFPWGVTTFSVKVNNYEEKTESIDIIMRYAQEAGIRSSVRDRIQLVCDELLMNALYHAPVDDEGRELYRDVSRKELARMSEVVSPVSIQYGCSGRYFGVSVRDTWGSLSRTKILDYLAKVGQNGQTQIEDKSTGAGLGLVSVLQSVSKLVFNIRPGVACEVIALFDVDLIARGKIGASSLNLFFREEGPDEPDTSSVSDDAAPAPVAEDNHHVETAEPTDARWLMVAVLLAITTALGIAYYFTRDARAVAPTTATIAVVTDPEDATIILNGNRINSNLPTPVPKADTYKLTVEKSGHQSWTKILTSTEIHGNVRLYVNLSQKP